MIKINELYSLENISDCYYVNDNCQVININTGHIKSQTLGPRGYFYVSLNEKITNRQVKVCMHKIIALAFINNGPYEVINHIDGNKHNNDVSNLEFCTQAYNTHHAFVNGLVPIYSKKYRIERFVPPFFISYHEGTMKELVNELKIPQGTLYDIFYKDNQIKNTYGILKIEIIEDRRSRDYRKDIYLA